MSRELTIDRTESQEPVEAPAPPRCTELFGGTPYRGGRPRMRFRYEPTYAELARLAGCSVKRLRNLTTGKDAQHRIATLPGFVALLRARWESETGIRPDERT